MGGGRLGYKNVGGGRLTRQQTLDSFETHRNVLLFQKGWSSPVHTYDTTTQYATHIALYARNVCGKLNTRNALG